MTLDIHQLSQYPDRSSDSSREWIEALVQRRVEPAITVKRRRRVPDAGEMQQRKLPAGPLESEREDASNPAPRERSARTFRLTAALPSADVGGHDTKTDLNGPVNVQPQASSTTFRRRRDPIKRPGIVSRTVFERPQSLSVYLGHHGVTSGSLDAGGYRAVMSSMDRLRTTMAEAEALSRFTLD